MSDDEKVITSSLTKGCFLFKPHACPSPKKKRKTDKNGSTLTAEDFFHPYPKETHKECSMRYEAYETCWTNLEQQIHEVEQLMNDRILDDLLQFVSNSQSNQQKPCGINEIPTAALLTGVNLPDHGVVFSQFVNKLKISLTQHVAQLQSKQCSSLKSMIKVCFESIVKGNDPDDVYQTDDSDNLNESKNQSKSKVFHDYTFTELKAWYTQQPQLSVSGILRSEAMDVVVDDENTSNDVITEYPAIVIIIEDFERFSPSILQDFILICSEYVTDLPITFIFGIATSVSVIHRSLPHYVSSVLSIEKFQATPSLVCLSEVIDKVLITDSNAFKLGPRVFRLLYEHFLYHDYSISNFVRGLKFSVLEHFYGSPFTILCTNDENEKRSYIKSLNAEKMELFQKIQSFKRYFDKKSELEQQKMRTNREYMKGIFLQLLQELQAQESLFYPAVKCFHKLTSKLPAAPVGKKLRDTYEYCAISSNITREKKYENALALLRFMSRDTLLPVLKECQEILVFAVAASDDCFQFESDVKLLEDFIQKFDHIDEVILEETNTSKGIDTKPAIYKSRYEFQQKLKLAVKEQKKESPYEKLRNEIVDVFDRMFRKYLISPLSIPLHEIFYYNDMETVQQHLNGTPRFAIQNALSNPNSYLKCTCCPPQKDVIQDTMPDICILYKLHLECGKLINLYDWLQAFITVIDPTVNEGKKTNPKKKIEEQLQARFIRAVSELQFIGFIKSTKRKTDHVARLTWGGC